MWDIKKLSQLIEENPYLSEYVLENVYACGKRDAVLKDMYFSYQIEEIKEISEQLKKYVISCLEKKYPDIEQVLNNKTLFVLRYGMDTCGFCIVSKKDISVEITHLYIKESYRRKGCGTRLLQGIVNKFPHKTYISIIFRTSFEEVKGLQEFMKFNGFRIRSEIKYACDKHYVDTYYDLVRDEKFF